MKKSRIFRSLNSKQRTEAGMALCLIFLLAGFLSKNTHWYQWAIPVLLLTMIYPVVFHPWALLWYAFSDLMGRIVSSIILSLLFFLLVTPTGFIRRLSGKDGLHLRTFKKNRKSVMVSRNHLYSSIDIENPF